MAIQYNYFIFFLLVFDERNLINLVNLFASLIFDGSPAARNHTNSFKSFKSFFYFFICSIWYDLIDFCPKGKVNFQLSTFNCPIVHGFAFEVVVKGVTNQSAVKTAFFQWKMAGNEHFVVHFG